MSPQARRALGILRHRFVLAPLLFILAVAGWNLYVVAHDDGIITGSVRTADGKPASGVEVVFLERDFVNYQEKYRTRTDVEGRYRFDNMQVYIGQIEARAPDGLRSERMLVRLWFRAQNTNLAPLILQKPKT
jgi:hypothetical protein